MNCPLRLTIGVVTFGPTVADVGQFIIAGKKVYYCLFSMPAMQLSSLRWAVRPDGCFWWNISATNGGQRALVRRRPTSFGGTWPSLRSPFGECDAGG